MTSQEAAKRYLEENESNQFVGDYPFLSLPDGPCQIRIIPRKDPKADSWIFQNMSYKVGPNARRIIERRQYGLQCNFMDHLDKLYAKGDEVSKKEADAMWPRKRVLFWVIDRADEAAGPKLWSTNMKVLPKIWALIADPDYKDLEDVVSGTDFTIYTTPGTKTRSGFPEWEITPKRIASPLGTAEKIVEWTKEDLFEKYKIAEPSTNEWIDKVLSGKDKEEQVAVGGAAPTSKAAPSNFDTNAMYWVQQGADVKEMSGTNLEMLLTTSSDWTGLFIMTHDQKSGWQLPEYFGFVKKVAAPAPTPAPAPASPSPAPAAAPAASPVDAMKADLLAKLAALNVPTAAPQSKVAQDLKASLKG